MASNMEESFAQVPEKPGDQDLAFDGSSAKRMSAPGCRVSARAGRARRVVALTLLLAVHAALLAWQGLGDSATWDEVGHFSAGLEHWRHGRFESYKVNPPLVRMVALAPVAILRPDLDPTRYMFWRGPGVRPEFGAGTLIARDLGPEYFWWVTVARWMCIPFSLLGVLVCYGWSRGLFGTASGFVAAALWTFSPSVLAYGHLITPDLGAAGVGVASAYLFRRWLHRPTLGRAAAAGIALGLTELTKSTWIILLVLWPVIWGGYRLLDGGAGLRRRQWLQQAGHIGLLLVLAVGVLNLGYGFDGSFKRLGDYQFVSTSLVGAGAAKTSAEGVRFGNRFADSFLRHVPLPLPECYVLGMDLQKLDFERKLPSYLRGEWREGGWWYYYLYALSIKEPIGSIALVLLALFAAILMRRQYAAPLREELLLLAPAAGILGFVSSQTGFSHHLRYVLPSLPFMFILASRVGRSWEVRHRTVSVLTCLALGASVVSSLRVVPHSLSYYNAFAGGPEGGYRHLANSNTDWGQDLLYLKRWYDRNKNVRPIHVAYDMLLVRPDILGIECGPVPVDPRSQEAMSVNTAEQGPRPGWFIVSVNKLNDHGHRYDYFRDLTPVGRIGYTMRVYHVTVEEANRMRNQFGLPEKY